MHFGRWVLAEEVSNYCLEIISSWLRSLQSFGRDVQKTEELNLSELQTRYFRGFKKNGNQDENGNRALDNETIIRTGVLQIIEKR